MSRYSSRRSRHKSSDAIKLWLTLLLAALTLGAAGFGAYLFFSAAPAIQRDALTQCPVQGPSQINVILIDTSDDVPQATRMEALSRLLDFAETVPDDGLLDIRLLDPASPAGRVIFHRCNPGDGKGLSGVTHNPALVQKRWRENFRAPLDKALESSFSTEDAATSPILSTLQGIALQQFTGASAERLPKRLLIVSDFLENTKQYSQYQGDLSYQKFMRMPFYKDTHTNLHRADVIFMYIQRTTRHVDSGKHIQFWLDWAVDNNGRPINPVKLQGLGK